MDIEDQPEYDQDDDSFVFAIPEENLGAHNSAAGSEQLDDGLGDDDNFLDDFASHQAIYGSLSGGDGHCDDDLPYVVTQLKKQLLKGYTLPPCPTEPPLRHTLSTVETLSLQHFLTWLESNGTVKAYNLFAQLLKVVTQEEILSLYMVKNLAMSLSGLSPSWIDMCPNSCMAFTGDFHSEFNCLYVRNGSRCNEPRYQSGQSSANPKPRATMLYIPIMPIIQAYFANAETSHQMRHRDHCLQKTLDLLAQGAGVKKSEFSNSENHVYHHDGLGLFRGNRDTALAISSDGAQLTMKKQSNMWLLIVILLNLPPEMCYKTNQVIIPLAIPGPCAPGNVESFIYPLFEEMAMASVGIWTWDAIDSAHFLLKAYICGVKGDMLGSAKLSGMAGHSAVHGDRFSLVEGARAAKGRGAKQYYPISPPKKETYNSKCAVVNLDNLPLRTQDHYWETIKRLESAANPAQRRNIVLDTGISHLTMCATSPAFPTHHFFH